MLPDMCQTSLNGMIGTPWYFTILDWIILVIRLDLAGMPPLAGTLLNLNMANSPNMLPKQREMDGIVRQIYEAIEAEDLLSSTLLVLCGDHGMTDAGNHGGSAPGETSPALVFMSPKLKLISSGIQFPAHVEENFQYYTTIEQSDIAPTLGALLGFPVPRNNLGAFIPQFMPFWSESKAPRVCCR